MDAIMFLELLEDEIKDMPARLRKGDAQDVAPTGATAIKPSKIDDKFKKPRISKGVYFFTFTLIIQSSDQALTGSN